MLVQRVQRASFGNYEENFSPSLLFRAMKDANTHMYMSNADATLVAVYDEGGRKILQPTRIKLSDGAKGLGTKVLGVELFFYGWWSS